MHLVRYHAAIGIDGFISRKDGSADWLNPYGKVAMGFIGPWMKQIGGVTAGSFLKEDLIDLVELAVAPVILGERRPLFSGVELHQTFEHASAQPIGCVVNSYRKIEARPATSKRRSRSH
jgi:hypothetical protein